VQDGHDMELWLSGWSLVRRAARQLARTPMFTASMLVSLALGIGAATAMVGLLDAVLLRPLSVRDPASLVLLTPSGTPPGGSVGPNRWSYPFFRELREHVESAGGPVAGVLAHFRLSANVAGTGEAHRVTAELVSGRFFELLGVGAIEGRTITPADDVPHGEPVAVISSAYWRSAFGGDRRVVGRRLVVNGHAVTIVGISEARFTGLELDFQPDVRMPLALLPRVAPFGWIGLENQSTRWVQVFARMQPGASASQVEAAIQPFYRGWLDRALRGPFAGSGAAEREQFQQSAIAAQPGAAGTSYLRGDWATPLQAMSGLAGLLLLLTAVNVAGLFIGRGIERRGELALRLGLGANRWQLVRELTVESLLLVVAGGSAAVLLAPGAAEAIVPFLPVAEEAPTISIALSSRIVAVGVGLMLVVAVIGGVLPAWLATRVDLSSLIAQASTRQMPRSRLRQALVSGEIALSLLLLFASGLFMRSLGQLYAVPAGFETAQTVAFGLDPTLNGYPRVRTEEIYGRVKAQLDATPGIESSAIGLVRLLSSLDVWAVGVTVQGRPAPAATTAPRAHAVSPDYFRTLGIALRQGRDLRASDDAAAPAVAVVNEAFVREYGLDGHGLGRRLTLLDGGNRPVQIVGVVADSHAETLRGAPPAQIFLPYPQFFTVAGMHGYVRSALPTAQVAELVRRAVAAVDPALPVHNIRTLSAQRDRLLATDRVAAGLAAAFGLLATLLAAVGLFGVIGYSLARRTRELGLRLALGAPRRRVAAVVVREVAALCAVGLVVAMPFAAAGSQLIAHRLYGVASVDPLAAGGAVGILLMAVAAAAAVPLRRVLRMDPAEVLRRD
jgi:predicted permease